MASVRIGCDGNGIWLPEHGLWLDAGQRRGAPDRVFVSHAHSDHIRAHREVILTEPTARFLKARLKGERQVHALAFGERVPFSGPRGEYNITLLPAGHILGSAMALVEAEGQSVLYSGDFKLRSGLAAEKCRPIRADVLIMETTFGRPEFRFPPAERTWADIEVFCREALASGATPVLLGYSLGKSQELLWGLAEAGLPVLVHPRVREMCEIYAHFSPRFPAFEAFDASRARGKVLVFPTHCRKTGALSQIGPIRTAVCTGWAMNRSCRYAYGTDAAFPLSDHADFTELIDFVRQVSPRKVYTIHGYAADFAQTLRDLGWDAQALSEPDQLGLPLFQ